MPDIFDLPGAPHGYRIIKLYRGGMAWKHNMELYFDYIIQIGTESLMLPEYQTVPIFQRKLKNHINSVIQLQIFNRRYGTTREISILLNEGSDNPLGVKLEYVEIPDQCYSLHVTDITANSPAYLANIQKDQDYILGSEDHFFQNVSDFIEFLQTKRDQAFSLIVYSSLTEKIRTVFIVSGRYWDGLGTLGCYVATGKLHNIPVPKTPLDSRDNHILEDSTDDEDFTSIPLGCSEPSSPASNNVLSNSNDKAITNNNVVNVVAIKTNETKLSNDKIYPIYDNYDSIQRKVKEKTGILWSAIKPIKVQPDVE